TEQPGITFALGNTQERAQAQSDLLPTGEGPVTGRTDLDGSPGNPAIVEEMAIAAAHADVPQFVREMLTADGEDRLGLDELRMEMGRESEFILRVLPERDHQAEG